MSSTSSHSRHTSSSSNYDNHDHSAPVIKPKLESIETSSASPNKSPVVTDSLPPSNLSDIESVDDRNTNKASDGKRELHVVNPETTTTSEAPDTTVVRPSSTSAKQKRSSSPAPSTHGSISSRDYQRTVSVKLSQLQDTSSLESLLAKPIHQQPANLTRASNRESVFSNISQYSGRIESSAEAVPVVLQRSDSTKIKRVKNKKSSSDNDDHAADTTETKSMNTVNSVETSQLLNTGKTPVKDSPHTPDDDQDDESDYDESSILMGKLPTRNTSNNMQLNPDKTFETSVEGAIPARSPRRPTSMLPPGTTSNDISTGLGDKTTRRRTMQITDDLDQLMQDASSISTFSSMKNHNELVAPQQNRNDEIGVGSAVFDTTGPHEDSDTESRGPEVPSHRYSTGTSSTKMTPLLKSLAVEDEELDHDSHSGSGNGNESDLITIAKREPSLPPRPSQENVLRARDVSANIQKQQQQQPNAATNEDQYYVNDENPNYDDEYYDIEEPIQHPSRGKSVKNSIRKPARNITNTATDKTTATPNPNKQQQHESKSSTSKKHKRRSKDKAKQHHRGAIAATSSSARPNELRPFSYKTLVSLLESMNGTIIGEEFNSLNIPIREKQLIEKIIDSLSRLSSDMILDQERYDVGLQRLEKALRVLEGFN
ncbi:hypothetical protein CORT_0E04670 [Candida orthopsilosis Co 90-125]|uniref:Uncharacterized protein n=1 Tax=Candida orthopsilosis (strain 90-125) TaxID=1136231 RepID=H8X7C3_CANO9|nr:hypothetical protein CORT_0E04670 [Candida orthopsilosis Co 90-125]CCG24052.1 hypothetical protein CORT_0E04670 [Candida orthopsilosis Co 90-125]